MDTIKTKKVFFTMLVFSVLISLVALGGCSEQATDNNGEINGSKAIATVNGVGITYDDLQAQILEFEQMAQMQGMDLEDPDTVTILENQAVEVLINEQLLLQEAENKDIQISQSEIDEHIDQMKSGFEDEGQFEEALAAQGVAIEELADLIREDMLIQAVFAEAVPNISVSEDDVTDEEINEVYEQQKQMAEAQGMDLPPLEELEAEIEAFIIQQMQEAEEQQAIENLLAELRESSEIEINL
ncbi:SurA N-terminal domain-containing protein [Dethiobacter alkaliphilus]|uniref:SurA N-terminal domain-containing protein n=1 Tax=Dethiobacter alkaliphilus TaxID=427926 RepID=UPI002227A58E|nr:SurA N-terminal domain-containing protein [Dethiobacter alkaliphilus]MCW3489898.1 SurA N-terminal domain-containing protein [Dethiobacter alkaliphilus]